MKKYAGLDKILKGYFNVWEVDIIAATARVKAKQELRKELLRIMSEGRLAHIARMISLPETQLRIFAQGQEAALNLYEIMWAHVNVCLEETKL